MSQTDLPSGGSASIVGETKGFDGNIPGDFTDGSARWLRSGLIETDPAKFDPDFWAGSIATYWPDIFNNGGSFSDIAANPAGVVIVTKSSDNAGGYLRSNDFGKTWLPYTITGFSTSQYLRAIKWIDSLEMFIAVGDAGKIYTSVDGASWISRISNTANNLLSLAFANGLLVAVGYSGEILTSTTGTSWTRRTSNNGGQNLLSICYGNGIWFAGGQSSSGYNCRSLDNGVTWQSVTVDASSYAGVTGAIHDGTKFICTVQNKGIYTSPDAVAWTLVNSKLGLNAKSGIAFEDGYYFVWGDSSGGIFARGKDLINWTYHALQPNLPSGNGRISGMRRLQGHYFALYDTGVVHRGNAYKYAGSPWPVSSGLEYTTGTSIALNNSVSFFVRIS